MNNDPKFKVGDKFILAGRQFRILKFLDRGRIVLKEIKK